MIVIRSKKNNGNYNKRIKTINIMMKCIEE